MNTLKAVSHRRTIAAELHPGMGLQEPQQQDQPTEVLGPERRRHAYTAKEKSTRPQAHTTVTPAPSTKPRKLHSN